MKELLQLPFKGCKYTFAVGIGFTRTVTVKARNEEQARDRAREMLDRRTDPAYQPVGWDITLVKVERVK